VRSLTAQAVSYCGTGTCGHGFRHAACQPKIPRSSSPHLVCPQPGNCCSNGTCGTSVVEAVSRRPIRFW